MRRSSRWLIGAVMVALFAAFIANVGCNPEEQAQKQKVAELENKVTVLTKQLEETHKRMEHMAMEFQKRMEMFANEVGKKGEMVVKRLEMQPRPMDRMDKFGFPPQEGFQERPDFKLQKGMKEGKRGFEPKEPKEFDRKLRKPDMEPGRPRDFEEDEDGFRPPPPQGKREFGPDREDDLDELLLDDDFDEMLDELLEEEDD